MSCDVHQALEAIAEAIRAGVPTLRTCGVIESALDEAEIARELHAAPAAMVGLRQFRIAGSIGGQPRIEISPAVYLLVDGVKYLRRMDEISALARRVADLVQHAGLGGLARTKPKNLTVSPRFSGALDSRGCSIWEIDWEQEIATGDAPSDEDLHLLRTITVGFTAVDPEPSAPEALACEACAAPNPGGDATGGDA